MGSVLLAGNSGPPIQPVLCPSTTWGTKDANSNVKDFWSVIDLIKDRSPTAPTVISRDGL
jgi:hypothetical protein